MDGGGGVAGNSCPTHETPWTVIRHTPLSMGFARQEYWSGSPFPSPGDLPHPGIKPGSPALLVESLPTEPPAKPYRMDMLSNDVLWCTLPNATFSDTMMEVETNHSGNMHTKEIGKCYQSGFS